jgi:hypothetical protein
MSDNSQNYSFTDDHGDKNRLFRSDSNSSLESFASAVSSFNDRSSSSHVFMIPESTIIFSRNFIF